MQRYKLDSSQSLQALLNWTPEVYAEEFRLLITKDEFVTYKSINDFPLLWTAARALPFMGDTLSFMRVLPQDVWPIHLDDRSGALNLPAYTREHVKSRTLWWENTSSNTTVDASQSNSQHTVFEKENMRIVYECEILIPHSVENLSDVPRWTVSWAIRRPYTYRTVLGYLRTLCSSN
jgi:hypothetical protein